MVILRSQHKNTDILMCHFNGLTLSSLTLHCHLHPLQAANCCRNSRLVVDENDLKWVKNFKFLKLFSKIFKLQNMCSILSIQRLQPVCLVYHNNYHDYLSPLFLFSDHVNVKRCQINNHHHGKLYELDKREEGTWKVCNNNV